MARLTGKVAVITGGAGGIGIDNVTVTNGAAQGVLVKNIVGSANLITIGSGAVAGDGGTLTTIGDAIDIDNADSVAVTQVTVNNTVGNGIKIHNQNDGNVLVTGLKTTITTGTGVIVEENTNGTSTFVNTEVDATGVNGGGVRLTNNTGATTSFQTIDIDTTSGTGFIATGNGTVSATGTNTITTTTGVGLSTNGVIIGAAGLNFNSVNVTNGASNGITLTDTTGGQVRVGSAAATGVDGTGGTLNTTGNSIVLSGVTNALFNDVTASTSGLGAQAVLVNHTSSTLSDYTFDNLTATMAAGTGNAVVLNDQGDGEVDFIMRNSTINTTASDTIGFLFDTADNAGEVDITLSGNSITAAGMSAVLATIDMGTGDIQFLMTSNTITNNDAGDAAANLNRIAGRNLNATIGGRGTGSGGNTFSNAAGTGLAVTSNHAGGRVDLDLRDNTATGLLFDYRLTNGLGDFGVVDRDDTLNDLNNTGNIDRNGSLITDFENIPSVLQVD